MAPSSGEPNGVNYPIPSHTASVPTFGAERGNPNGTKPEQLYYFENKVSQNLAHEVEVAEAMYQIYFRKLFTETGLPYYAYIKAKWDISRSRAYQLLHYARPAVSEFVTSKRGINTLQG